MKKRWLKSVVDNSKQQAPTLPFHRSARQTIKRARLVALPAAVKTA
jgi:hypothetical protein